MEDKVHNLLQLQEQWLRSIYPLFLKIEIKWKVPCFWISNYRIKILKTKYSFLMEIIILSRIPRNVLLGWVSNLTWSSVQFNLAVITMEKFQAFFKKNRKRNKKKYPTKTSCKDRNLQRTWVQRATSPLNLPCH